MLRTLLIATALLTASGMALAHGDYGYGRVVRVEPSISVSFGTGYHDGFRVLYESGGTRYWTHTPYHPGHVIVVPHHRHHVKHVHHYRDYGRGWDDRHDWREDRREHRRKHHRHHDRD